MSHKLKYYCRGLGTGILVTALVLMARPSSGQESLTNEEIIARAEALGMKKIGSLTDLPQPSKTEAASTDETGEAGETAQSTESGTAETQTETNETQTAETDTEANETQTAETETIESGTETSDNATNPSEAESESSSRESTSAATSQDSAQDAENDHTDQSVQPTTSEQAPSSSIEADGQTATITIYRGNGSLTVSRALAQAGLVDDAKAYDQYLCDEGYDNALRVGVYHIPLGSTYEQIARIITGKSP